MKQNKIEHYDSIFPNINEIKMTKPIDYQTLFPLYNELQLLIIEEDVSKMNWGLFSSKINSMEDKDIEILYGLIFVHYVKDYKITIKEDKKIVPYKGKLLANNCGILLHISELPQNLQLLLWTYVNL